MGKLITIVVALSLLGCGKRPPPAPVEPTAATSPPAPAPTEPTPFTVTYTWRGKPDGPPLLFMLGSDGTVDATTETPPARYSGKIDDTLLGDITRLIADPTVRALPAVNENGPTPIIELELLDHKGTVWRRRFTGDAPSAISPLFDRLENLQTAARREVRPPGVIQIDHTRTPADGPAEKVTVMANSLVLVTRDGKPKALGRVGGRDLDSLRIAAGALERLRPTSPGGAAPAARHALHVQRGDDSVIDLAFDGGIPLAAEPLFAIVDQLEKGAEPVAPFDKITYKVQVPGKGKKGLQILTILPSGEMTLVADGQTLGSRDAALEDLWGLHAALVTLEAVPPGKPVGQGAGLTLEVDSPSGRREVRSALDEPPAEAKKTIAYMRRFMGQLTPLPDAPP